MKTIPPRTRSGFSLIEILIVIAIIAVLATILVPRLLTGGKDASGKKVLAPRQRAQQAAGVEYISQINAAIAMYKIDHDEQSPPSLQELTAYKVTDEMLLDPVTHQPLAYDPQTGRVGNSNGPDSLGGGASLPQVGGQ